MAKLGITDGSMLRTALRELTEINIQESKQDEIKLLERKLVGIKIQGFFPTPQAIAFEMVERAQLNPDDAVCEPSAGNGNIANIIRKAGCKPEVVEVDSRLVKILEAKGYRVVGRNFLQFFGKYDKFIMNPPFENGQDIDHVRHAYDILNPGGRIIAIICEGSFFRQDQKCQAFRAWLAEVGGVSERLPDGSFMDASNLRTTGVKARLVIIDK